MTIQPFGIKRHAIFLFLLIVLTGATNFSTAQAKESVVCSEKTCFETKKAVAGKKLFLRGIAFFQRAFVKMYKVGLYVPNAAHNAKQVLGGEVPKVLVVEYDRDVDIRELFDQMKKDLPVDKVLTDQFVQIIMAVSPIREGERHEFMYVPGKGTVIIENGRPKLRIPGERFARSFFGFWLDRHNSGNVLLRPHSL